MLRPGDTWGAPGELPTDAPVVHSDHELAGVAADAEVVAVAGGDLCRTLGGRGDVASRLGQTVHLVPVDLADVIADGRPTGPAVAHVVARGRWWSGETLVVMNAEWLGEWDMAPRAHPGDGRLDVISGSLGWRERWLARSRARTGDHLPHPALRVARRASVRQAFDRSRQLWIDGRPHGRVRELEVTLTGSVMVAV